MRSPEKKHEILSKLGSNPTLIDKKLVVNTRKIIKLIKGSELIYNQEKERIEPKYSEKNLKTKGNLNEPNVIYGTTPVMWRQLNLIRTEAIEEFKKNGPIVDEQDID